MGNQTMALLQCKDFFEAMRQVKEAAAFLKKAAQKTFATLEPGFFGAHGPNK